MDLGQKIRLTRQELGLSQRQLCADQITRNMLSQIENGSARPSMDTLSYLAARLGKSVSYFLEEQAVVSPNMALMEQARQHYSRQEYRKALDILTQYKAPDPLFEAEYQHLVLLSCMAEAQAALAQQRLPYARQTLEQARDACGIYACEPVRLQLRLLRFQAGLDPEGPLNWDALLFSQAEAQPDRALQLLFACEDRSSPLWHLHVADTFFAQGDYSSARVHYLACEEAFPQSTIPKLELCCKELGDYKSAYEYACKQR